MTRALALPPAIKECRVCGGKHLTWQTNNITLTGIVQGRLRTSDVQCQFFLGCDECSETLAVIGADEVAAAWNGKA